MSRMLRVAILLIERNLQIEGLKICDQSDVSRPYAMLEAEPVPLYMQNSLGKVILIDLYSMAMQ